MTPLWIEPPAPFRLDLTVWLLRRRPQNHLDEWDGRSYRRILRLAGRWRELVVMQDASAAKPRLRVSVTGPPLRAEASLQLGALVRRLLGLDVDLRRFYQIGARQRRLTELLRRFRGFRPPRFPTVYEALLNAITCQQISLVAGLAILNRLAAEYGPRIAGDGSTLSVPPPETLSRLRVPTLRRIGYSGAKARAMIGLAREIAAGRLDPESLDCLDDTALRERLMAIPGVGPWTAEYGMLRGLGRIGLFPTGDVGARKALTRLLGLRRPLDDAREKKVLRVWRPYAGLIYFHMLLAGLAEKGLIL